MASLIPTGSPPERDDRIPLTTGYVGEGETLVVPAGEQLLTGRLRLDPDAEIDLRENASIHVI